MKKEIILDRKLVCRIIAGENVLDELLRVMFDEPLENIKSLVKNSHNKPIRIVGGEDKGDCLLCRAILNAGGIAFITGPKEGYIDNIPVLVLTKNVKVAPRKDKAVKKTAEKVLELLKENGEISAFYKIGENRWAVETNDKYFGIYDTEIKTFVD